MTVSFHKFGDFFPGTGDVRDVGMKRGKGYAVNVPLKDGVGETEFAGIFRPVSCGGRRDDEGQRGAGDAGEARPRREGQLLARAAPPASISR
jgi:hypothetical protein